MRMSRHETANTRRRIVAAASAEFRKNGIGSTALADLMSAAGLTHGGFYRHFDSKEQLVAEATAASLEKLRNRTTAATSKKSLKEMAATYLSISHRDNPGTGCPLAAIGGEFARCDGDVRKTASACFVEFTEVIAELLEKEKSGQSKKDAMVIAATMIGALTMSRILTDKKLSELVLRYAEESITGLKLPRQD